MTGTYFPPRCCKATESLAGQPLFDDFAKELVRLDRVEANVKVHGRLNVTVAQKLPNRFVLAGCGRSLQLHA